MDRRDAKGSVVELQLGSVGPEVDSASGGSLQDIGQGETQTVRITTPYPNGATGYPDINVKVI